MVYFTTYFNSPGYCCQRSAFFVTITLKWSNVFLHRMGKALCARPFVLHLQKPEKYKQNVDVATPWKNFCGRQWKGGLGPFWGKFVDYCCTQYC